MIRPNQSMDYELGFNRGALSVLEAYRNIILDLEKIICKDERMSTGDFGEVIKKIDSEIEEKKLALESTLEYRTK